MNQTQVITNWLQEQLPEFMDNLHALVNVDCGTANKVGVDEVGLFFRSLLRANGFELTEFPLVEYGDCCLASLYGIGTARILLIGHLDTVFPDGTVAARPMRVKEKRAFGPGVSDMKAGLLAGLYAVRALQHIGFDDFARIDFFLNTDEEVDSPVSRSIYEPTAKMADAVLVLEAARENGDIVGSRKGCAVYELIIFGRQAHAGVEPEKGASAIVEMIRCIKALTALNGLHPGTTVNVGVIGGGTEVNVVPDKAWAKVDVRFNTLKEGQKLDREIRQLAKSPTVEGTRIEIKGGIEKGAMEKTKATTYLIELAQDVAANLGFSINDVHTGGTSDANHVGKLNIPVLDGLGPIGGDDHSPYEFLDLDSIVPRTALLAGLIQSITSHLNKLSTLH